MNEQIRELRRQATLVETYTSHDGSVHEGKSVDLEKFAELIVRECIKITIPDTEYPNEGNDWEQGFHIGKEDAADHIKEHFGVE